MAKDLGTWEVNENGKGKLVASLTPAEQASLHRKLKGKGKQEDAAIKWRIKYPEGKV